MIHKLNIYKRRLARFFKNYQYASEEVKIIYVYRYLSWGLTSLVYLIGKPYYIIYFKLGVIISLYISSKIITDLYIKHSNHKVKLRTLVMIETIGIMLLLLPTGGMTSPFMWYALNPTLVAASYLPSYFCWINLAIYLSVGTSMSYVFFNPTNIKGLEMLMNNSNLLLVFILITLAVQLLSNFTKRLHQQTIELMEQRKKMQKINNELQLSNNQKQESIEHIMSLYQIMETFNNHSTKDKLFEALVEYTTKLTKSDFSFIWLLNINGDDGNIITNRKLESVEQQEILRILKLGKLQLMNKKVKRIEGKNLFDEDFFVASILSSSNYYGLLGIQLGKNHDDEVIQQYTKILEFISKVSAVTLDRFHLEKIESNLLIMEEQNRIANEIHDSVSQRLFSISYSIHGLLGKWNGITKNDLWIYLREIRDSSNLAMQELRNSIYQLSSRKKGEKSLQVTLKSFLDSISALNGIEILFNVDGDEVFLSLPLKKAINRIVREASSNALRHGQCGRLYIKLQIYKEYTSLYIIDDGKGFNLDIGSRENQTGLGLSNISNLVSSFNGNIDIISNLEKGTEICVILPNEGLNISNQGEMVI